MYNNFQSYVAGYISKTRKRMTKRCYSGFIPCIRPKDDNAIGGSVTQQSALSVCK